MSATDTQPQSLAAAIGQQVVDTAKAAAPAVVGAALIGGALANPQAAGAVLGATAALPYAMNMLNSAMALANIGTMTQDQVLQLLHQTSDNIRAHQAALDALDPAYAASVPMAAVPPATTGLVTVTSASPAAPGTLA